MAQNIWVVAEQWRGQATDATFELLALGRELADGLGTSLETVLFGHGVGDLAGEFGASDTVLAADHPAFAVPTAEAFGAALASLVKERQPRCVLVPLTNVLWDALGILPAELDGPFINFCQDVRVSQGRIEADCLLYGGKMRATVVPTGDGAVFGLASGVRPPDQGRVDRTPTVEAVAPAVPTSLRVQFKDFHEPEAADVDITQQDVLVAVGRGIQTQDNVELAEELATALGGATCASRPVIDQGWLPLARQVGKSGATVKPKLYIAAGISGAPEHTEGMKDAELIIAINTDPEAPIFGVAHYGIVEDATDVLPALTESLAAMKE
jgi:electron transfer flavoprotein alpha subunit